MKLYRCAARLPILGYVLVLLAAVFSPRLQRMLVSDDDSYLHLRLGEEILRTGQVPATDPLSHTRGGEGYLDYEWGFQVLLAFLNRHLGLDSLLLVGGVFAALTTFFILKRMVHNRLGVVSSTIGFVFAGSLLMSGMMARPHLVTWVGIAGGMLVLDLGIWKRRHWSVPLLSAATFAAWMNMHPGCLIFLGILGIELCALTFKALWTRQSLNDAKWGLGVLTAAVLGALINPQGLRVVDTVLSFTADRRFNGLIAEHTPAFYSPVILFFFLLMLGCSCFAFSRRRISARPGELVVLAVLTMFALSAVRHVQIFAIVASCLAAISLARFISEKPGETAEIRGRWKLDTAIMGLSTALVVAFIWGCDEPLSRNAYLRNKPTEAVAFLRRHARDGAFGKKLFNTYGMGGFLGYEVPEIKTFIDGRAEFFGADFLSQVINPDQSVEVTRHLFEKHQVDWAFLPTGHSLGRWLESIGWKRVYRDMHAVVYSKTPVLWNAPFGADGWAQRHGR